MGLSINNNIAAMNSYRNLSTTQNDLGKSLEKLSSGLRINRAADDAAGLAISEGLRSQIGGTKQAVRNAQDGISVVQTAEGALTETHSILQRMRTLSVQAANTGSLSETAKGNIKDEMDELTTELTRIADTTSFNGRKLLDGTYSGQFQVGANTSAADTINVKIGTAAGGGLGADGLKVHNLDVTKQAEVTNGSTVTGATLSLTATAVPSNVEVLGKAIDLSEWDKSGTADAAAANKTLLESKLTDALAASDFTVKVEADTTTVGLAKLSFSTATKHTAPADVVTALDLAGFGGTIAGNVNQTVKVEGAKFAVDAIDAAITEVSKVRSGLGAVQNRFDHTINNLNVAVENLSASESRIRDTDMAQEMVQFTRSQILSQAGTAMLAQAKNLPQSITQLLQ